MIKKDNKIVISLILLIIFGLSFVNAETPKSQNNLLVVYYFHRTFRCPSCTLLEKLTRESVKLGFEKELNNGMISIKAINVDEKANEHFVSDYNLSGQSVVLSSTANGKENRWKNLDKVWDFLHNEGQLVDYIQKEIRGYIKG